MNDPIVGHFIIHHHHHHCSTKKQDRHTVILRYGMVWYTIPSGGNIGGVPTRGPTILITSLVWTRETPGSSQRPPTRHTTRTRTTDDEENFDKRGETHQSEEEHWSAYRSLLTFATKIHKASFVGGYDTYNNKSDS
eukprot:scaffold4545_cov139-Amphora_coffeaeformis.AAC.5